MQHFANMLHWLNNDYIPYKLLGFQIQGPNPCNIVLPLDGTFSHFCSPGCIFRSTPEAVFRNTNIL